MKKNLLGVYWYLGEKLTKDNESQLEKLHDEIFLKRVIEERRCHVKCPFIMVNKEGCWIWQKRLYFGYGHIYERGKTNKAHKFSYEKLVSSVPEGLVLDHLCRNRACCNPEHLEPVTIRENILRGEGGGGKNARKSFCMRGHILSPPILRKDGYKKRRCKECSKLAVRKDRMQKRHGIDFRINEFFKINNINKIPYSVIASNFHPTSRLWGKAKGRKLSSVFKSLTKALKRIGVSIEDQNSDGIEYVIKAIEKIERKARDR